MNREILQQFSRGTRDAIEALAASPADAAALLNRLQVVRAALRIGVECIQIANAVEKTHKQTFLADAAIASCTALECTMNLLQQIHPEIGAEPMKGTGKNGDGASHAPNPKTDGMDGSRFKFLDTD